MKSLTTNQLTDSEGQNRCGDRKGKAMGSPAGDMLICMQKSACGKSFFIIAHMHQRLQSAFTHSTVSFSPL